MMENSIIFLYKGAAQNVFFIWENDGISHHVIKIIKKGGRFSANPIDNLGSTGADYSAGSGNSGRHEATP